MTPTHITGHAKAMYHTFGCKLNFAETASLSRLLEERGVTRADKTDEPDVIVINSCSVTELADKKCRQTIRSLARKHPQAGIVVTGCYAQLKPQEVKSLPGVVIVAGADQKGMLPDMITDWLEAGRESVEVSAHRDISRFIPSCSRGDRTRYFLKVQDGCNYYCSYCTIPLARGHSRSGEIGEIVEQARKVAAEGGREIVITGVNIGDFGYGRDDNFFDLIRRLDEVEGIDRYRISSIEPNLLTDEIIEWVAKSRAFMPHFHIPLQAGDDEVLKLMRRRYDTALFRHKIEKIKEIMPHAFIGVDVIVGTRGETDEFFEDARNFINSLDISQLHVFSYSERPGTQALKIAHSVDPKVKHARSQQLLDISDRKLHAFYDAHIGSQAEVLFEHTRKDGRMHGFTENYIKVEIPYNSSLVNETRRVTLTGWNEDRTALNCELVTIG